MKKRQRHPEYTRKELQWHPGRTELPLRGRRRVPAPPKGRPFHKRIAMGGWWAGENDKYYVWVHTPRWIIMQLRLAKFHYKHKGKKPKR